MTELRQAWRIARTSALYEFLLPGRLAGVAAQLAVQIFLTWCLWRALYATVSASAGLDRGQAVSYAVLATLYGRLRGPDRGLARDAVRQHVYSGTIVYWYLRPVTPLHVPLSLYVGRIVPADAGRYVLVQVVWIVLLAVVLRLFWRRADRQVVVQGG